MSENEEVSYSKLFRFFLPLAATPVMIGLTHSIINSALARLPYPEESIAVFTIVKGVVMIVSAPTLMSLQLVVSFVDDMESCKKAFKFVWTITGILLSILVLAAYTPLGGWVFRNLMGLKQSQQISFAYSALRFACLLPVVQTLRNSHQGLAISLNKTKFFVPGVTIRLIAISLFLWWAVSTQALLGVVAGGITWVAGIGIEGIFITLGLRYYYNNNLKNAFQNIPDRNKKELKTMDMLKFFLPLGFMVSLGAFVQPIIQGGIARGQLPTESLAAYGVGWGLIAIITGPLGLLHQLALVHTKGTKDKNWKPVKRFSLITGLILASVILLLGLTPIGFWIINHVISVSEKVTHITQQVLLAFFFYPIIRSFRESYWGLLMRHRTTSLIAIAKATNITVVALTLTLGIILLKVQPAVLGALAFSSGESVESLIIWYYAMRSRSAESLAQG